MKLGIYGNGMIVNFFLSEAHNINGLEVKAITGRAGNEKKLQDICEKYKILDWYTDVDSMLKDDEIDAVYVAVPNNLHYAYAKRVLSAGKHVICEKPFTSNIEEAEELASIARDRHVLLLEAVTTHYFPNTDKIKERLPEIGNIKIVSINYSQYSSRYDRFKNGEILPAFDAKMSGGALMDINIYNINLLVHLFGKPLSAVYYPNMENGIDTSGIMIFDYGSFKCTAIGAKDCKAPASIEIEGDMGSISIPSSANVMAEFEVSMIRPGAEAGFEMENYNSDQFHMYHEFVEFERMIREKDFEKAEQMLEMSLTVMQIQTDLRKKAGIMFDADKK